jgi:galactose mutarotase-like enzyme
MPVAPWHHTYYRVDLERKWDVVLSENMGVSEEAKENWLLAKETVKISNPWKFQIYLPWVGTVEIKFDSRCKDVRLWTEPNKWFVCVEPVTCHPSEREISVASVNPWEKKESWFSITLLKKDK